MCKLEESIKVRFTGKFRRTIEQRAVEYDGDKWDAINRTLSRQKTNLVAETTEEAQAVVDKLEGYENGRTWMDANMNKCASRVVSDVRDALESTETVDDVNSSRDSDEDWERFVSQAMSTDETCIECGLTVYKHCSSGSRKCRNGHSQYDPDYCTECDEEIFHTHLGDRCGCGWDEHPGATDTDNENEEQEKELVTDGGQSLGDVERIDSWECDECEQETETVTYETARGVRWFQCPECGALKDLFEDVDFEDDEEEEVITDGGRDTCMNCGIELVSLAEVDSLSEIQTIRMDYDGFCEACEFHGDRGEYNQIGSEIVEKDFPELFNRVLLGVEDR